MFEAIIQLDGNLEEKHRILEPKGYRYIRSYSNGTLREQCPDSLKYDDFDLFESDAGEHFCYRFWQRTTNDIGHGPYYSWSFEVPVSGFLSLQAAIDHALSVYCGDRKEAQLELTEQQRQALSKVYEIAIQVALRAEREEKEREALGLPPDERTVDRNRRKQGEIKYPDVVSQLSENAKLVSPREAELSAPRKAHGIYAICIDDARNLPVVFRKGLERKNSRILYVGKAAQQTLHTRLVAQDLRHRKASTFFRGLGAALGFYPPKGSLRSKKNQNNYKFSTEDTEKIIGWIDAHLSVCWVTMSPDEAQWNEFSLIHEFCPPFNTTHNEDAVEELALLKANCRLIARS